MFMQNKYQCLRIPKHSTAFYYSVGTARNVRPMARDVINYPLLQQMLQGARHMKQKTCTEDQTKTSDSNIPCKKWTGVLCVWKPFSSKIKLLFVLEQKTGIKYQNFSFCSYLFVHQLPARLHSIFLPQFSFIYRKPSCPLHLW